MIGIVIATHGDIGSALVDSVKEMIGEQIDQLVAVKIAPEMGRQQGWDALTTGVQSVEGDSGVLVMVDMFGGTPSNLSMALLAERPVEVLTGVNLAMVLRAVLHRSDHDLMSLAKDVLAYGRRNVTASAEWLSPKTQSDEPTP